MITLLHFLSPLCFARPWNSSQSILGGFPLAKSNFSRPKRTSKTPNSPSSDSALYFISMAQSTSTGAASRVAVQAGPWASPANSMTGTIMDTGLQPHTIGGAAMEAKGNGLVPPKSPKGAGKPQLIGGLPAGGGRGDAPIVYFMGKQVCPVATPPLPSIHSPPATWNNVGSGGTPQKQKNPCWIRVFIQGTGQPQHTGLRADGHDQSTPRYVVEKYRGGSRFEPPQSKPNHRNVPYIWSRGDPRKIILSFSQFTAC